MVACREAMRVDNVYCKPALLVFSYIAELQTHLDVTVAYKQLGCVLPASRVHARYYLLLTVYLRLTTYYVLLTADYLLLTTCY